MSHFSVLVITETPEGVEAALQPFHEYECTGIKDKYVVPVDVEESYEELNSDYLENIDEEERKEVSLSDYVKEMYGYEFIDGKFTRFTNPNAKWDWWMIGGRWSGFFLPKDPTVGIKGSAGLMGIECDSKGVDQCIKSNVDFDARMTEVAVNAAKKFDHAHSIIKGRVWASWVDFRENKNLKIDEARKFYHEQEAVKDLEKEYDNTFFCVDEFLCDRDKYIDTKSNSAVSTFAVIKDGAWHEKGSMRWYGCVANEKDQDKWNSTFLDLLNDIPDHYCLTVVDCHI